MNGEKGENPRERAPNGAEKGRLGGQKPYEGGGATAIRGEYTRNESVKNSHLFIDSYLYHAPKNLSSGYPQKTRKNSKFFQKSRISADYAEPLTNADVNR